MPNQNTPENTESELVQGSELYQPEGIDAYHDDLLRKSMVEAGYTLHDIVVSFDGKPILRQVTTEPRPSNHAELVRLIESLTPREPRA